MSSTGLIAGTVVILLVAITVVLYMVYYGKKDAIKTFINIGNECSKEEAGKLKCPSSFPIDKGEKSFVYADKGLATASGVTTACAPDLHSNSLTRWQKICEVV